MSVEMAMMPQDESLMRNGVSVVDFGPPTNEDGNIIDTIVHFTVWPEEHARAQALAHNQPMPQPGMPMTEACDDLECRLCSDVLNNTDYGRYEEGPFCCFLLHCVRVLMAAFLAFIIGMFCWMIYHYATHPMPNQAGLIPRRSVDVNARDGLDLLRLGTPTFQIHGIVVGATAHVTDTDLQHVDGPIDDLNATGPVYNSTDDSSTAQDNAQAQAQNSDSQIGIDASNTSVTDDAQTQNDYIAQIIDELLTFRSEMTVNVAEQNAVLEGLKAEFDAEVTKGEGENLAEGQKMARLLSSPLIKQINDQMEMMEGLMAEYECVMQQLECKLQSVVSGGQEEDGGSEVHLSDTVAFAHHQLKRTYNN